MTEVAQLTREHVAEAPARPRPRLGLLGLGWIGLRRLAALVQSDVAEIHALADPAGAAINAARGLSRNAVCIQDFDELLEQDLDGLVIATPSALHAEQAIAALERGFAVFCQKPLARTAEETQLVIDAARAANRLLAVDFSYRYTAGMQAIRKLIERDQLGNVFAVEMVFHNAYGPDKPWFYQPQLSGGGCLIDLGTHLVDLTLWCLGFPRVEEITGRLLAQGGAMTDRQTQVEDYAAAQLHLDTGAVVQLACSWRAPTGGDARIEAHFHGSRGGATFRNVNGSFVDFVAEQFLPDRSRKLLAAPPDDWGGRAITDWARRLGQSREFDPDIQCVQQTAAVLDVLYHAK